MPDRDTVKTQSWDTRHDDRRQLETEPRQDIQVSRLSQDRDMKNHVSRVERVSRQGTCLKTPSLTMIVNCCTIYETSQFLANVNCCRQSVCRLSVWLSVGNARAPYSDGCNFRQFFYGIWYLGHPLTFTKKFTEAVPGEPIRRES